MKPSTDGDGYKSVSTKRGLGGGNILPWAIFVLASALGWPSKIFNNHALKHKNHHQTAKTIGEISTWEMWYFLSHLSDEKLTYPKPATYRLTGG
jgi:hypothetical protein